MMVKKKVNEWTECEWERECVNAWCRSEWEKIRRVEVKGCEWNACDVIVQMKGPRKRPGVSDNTNTTQQKRKTLQTKVKNEK